MNKKEDENEMERKKWKFLFNCIKNYVEVKKTRKRIFILHFFIQT